MIPLAQSRASACREAARRSRVLAGEVKSPELRQHYTDHAARLEQEARAHEKES